MSSEKTTIAKDTFRMLIKHLKSLQIVRNLNKKESSVYEEAGSNTNYYVPMESQLLFDRHYVYKFWRTLLLAGQKCNKVFR